MARKRKDDKTGLNFFIDCNVIMHELNPIISVYATPELFVTIDSLRGKMSRSAFCRMALSEYCAAIKEMESNSSNSENSRNLEYPNKKSKKLEDNKEIKEN